MQHMNQQSLIQIDFEKNYFETYQIFCNFELFSVILTKTTIWGHFENLYVFKFKTKSDS